MKRNPKSGKLSPPDHRVVDRRTLIVGNELHLDANTRVSGTILEASQQATRSCPQPNCKSRRTHRSAGVALSQLSRRGRFVAELLVRLLQQHVAPQPR